MTNRILDKLFLVLSFALPLAVYGMTLAPDLVWAHYGADGGDLITAAFTLGVPHPPGYPTYTLLAWLFTRLPWGTPAWRVNLLSACSVAGTAALVYVLVGRLDPVRTGQDGKSGREALFTAVAGLVAAWTFAFSPLVWSQALIAEVYGLAGLWTAVFLILAIEVARTARSGFLLGLMGGLGTGIHLTLLSLVPVLLWVAWKAKAFVLRWMVAGFLVGLWVWLYLPLRANQGGVTWGQPGTLAGLWWVVSGALYGHYVFALPIAAWGERLIAWLQIWIAAMGLIGIALLATTAFSLVRRPRHRGWGSATGLSFILLNLYALGYNTADSVVYLIPAFVLGSVWLGLGWTELFRRAWRGGRTWREEKRIGTGVGLSLLLIVVPLFTPIWNLIQTWPSLDVSQNREAQRFGEAVMQSAPPRAVLCTTTDRQTFALWYSQRVKGMRPDVAVVDTGLIGFGWYRDSLQARHPDLWSGEVTESLPRCRVLRAEVTERGWLDCRDPCQELGMD